MSPQLRASPETRNVHGWIADSFCAASAIELAPIAPIVTISKHNKSHRGLRVMALILLRHFRGESGQFYGDDTHLKTIGRVGIEGVQVSVAETELTEHV